VSRKLSHEGHPDGTQGWVWTFGSPIDDQSATTGQQSDRTFRRSPGPCGVDREGLTRYADSSVGLGKKVGRILFDEGLIH
jgi:hypothetical protein